MNARDLFRACVLYLEAAGWYRDGDDAGTWWLQPGSGTAYAFSEALELQLEADGVSLLETA
jgi:hypothetical protein